MVVMRKLQNRGNQYEGAIAWTLPCTWMCQTLLVLSEELVESYGIDPSCEGGISCEVDGFSESTLGDRTSKQT